jgi:outer membrane protein assembly factor BamE (lipoprotein component of BamABCDE complex)
MRRRAEALALLAALLLAGCALPGPRAKPGPVFRDPALSVQRAAELVAPGRSRKQDVAALLGPAESVRFDTGWEVWAYRSTGERGAPAAEELVLLFDPAGVLRKVRAATGAADPLTAAPAAPRSMQ